MTLDLSIFCVEWIFYSYMILISIFSKTSKVILKTQGKQMTLFSASDKKNGQIAKIMSTMLQLICS